MSIKGILMKYLWPIFFLSFPLLLESKVLEAISPPKAKKKEKILVHHGDKRIDSFYWLREKENPEVIKYLTNENSYSQKKWSPLKNYKMRFLMK